jgi:hypothetical protein
MVPVFGALNTYVKPGSVRSREHPSFASARSGVTQQTLTWELARQVVAVLDAARRDAGIVYPADEN